MAAYPSSILVYVGLDRVGDGLMKLPFVRALRAAFPAARITWLAGKGPTVYRGSLAPLVRPLIDEVIEDAGIGCHWWELARRPQRRVLTTAIIRRLRHQVFLSSAADWWLSDLRPPKGTARPKAMIGQLFDLLSLASGAPAQYGAPLSLDPAMQAQATDRLPDGRIYVGLAPGAGGKHKCWPLENFIALAMRQVKDGRTPVIFLGPDERQWEAEVRDAVPGAILPLDTGGSPLFTIALARRLAVAVANDSGAGHMIAAADVPMVSLFGPTSPEKFAPVTSALTVLRAQDFGGDTMRDIPLTSVATAIDRLLARSFHLDSVHG
jgi:ADP-heptose:LPS heptosyltransferase